jgi:cell division control protein 24
VKSELPAFLIKPVQRICKYPLLIDVSSVHLRSGLLLKSFLCPQSLIKVTNAEDYPYYEELKEGSAAAKRITDKINEAQRRAENEQTVKDLEGRIEDWKGHHLSNFGELILDDIFVVKKSGVDREYHVFLFEKIILCCKDAPIQPNGKKSRQNGSILKKPPSAIALAVGFGPPPKRNTPLLLKGRIFLNNVTKAIPVSPRNSTGEQSVLLLDRSINLAHSAGGPVVSSYALEVWWRGDDDLEYFTLRCRTEEQLKLWETQINRLIKEVMSRRHAERGVHRAASQANSTNPALGRHFTQRLHDRKMSVSTQSSHLGPPVVTPLFPSSISPGPITPGMYGGEDHFDLTPSTPYATGGAQANYGALAYEGFEFDEDEFEDHGASSSADYSGRGTPLGATATMRRSNAMSMPPEREAIPGYDRPRAQTEDTNGHVISQWRTMPGIPLPATPAANVLPLRPVTPRLQSAASLSSFPSINEMAGHRPPSSQAHYSKTLRGQPSQTKIRNGHDDGRAKTSTPVPSSVGGTGPPLHRVRSASQPTAYSASKNQPPPMPNSSSTSPSDASATTMSSNPKRGSGSSQSTGESSEYSPNSSSPITPFGSSESSLAMGVRPSRSQGFDNAVNGGHGPVQFPAPVKVKVHYHEDIFVIQVPRTTEYTDLLDQVGKKIRLCGPRREDGPLRVKYKDEDGDMVSVGSTEDVQMAFESFKLGGQVTLFVT